MGTLQLAGVVSGLGKGLEQGLQNTQQYMTYSMLQQERDEMERKRMDITYGREKGLLQERLAGERANNLENAKMQNDFNNQLLDKKQTFESGESQKTRDYNTQKDALDADRAGQAATVKRQQQLEDAFRERGYTLEDAKRKAQEEIDKEARSEKRDIRKEGREAGRDEKKFQREAGKDIVLESMRGQRPTSGGAAKLDPQTNAQLNVLKDRLNSLDDEYNNVMTTDERRAQIQKEKASLVAQQNSLINLPSTQRERPPIRFPQ